MGRGAGAYFCGAGLGADQKITEVFLPVLGGNVICHHFHKKIAGFVRKTVGNRRSMVDTCRKTGRGGFLFNQNGEFCRTAASYSAHKHHHAAGVHGIVILTDAGPAKVIAFGNFEGACGSVDAADLVGREESALVGVFCQHFAAHFNCQLCVNACPKNAIEFTNEFENAVFDRKKLIIKLNK